MDWPWIAHYDPNVPARIEYPEITLPEFFRQTAVRFPKRTATVFHEWRQRYAEVDRDIDALAAGLRDLGIEAGDRVALMLPNVPQYVVAFFGILRAGAIVVPTNPLYTEHELEHQLDDASAMAVITLDQLFGRVQAALPYTTVRTVIVTGIGEVLPARLRPLYTAKVRREGVRSIPAGGIVHRFGTLLRSEPRALDGGKPEDLAVLQYTGGLSGRRRRRCCRTAI
jgi:long-chain acyl-CoA synthetase